MREQRPLNARQPANEHRRVLAPVVWLSVMLFSFYNNLKFSQNEK